MINNLMWIVTVIAIWGTVLNARAKISGFYVWLLSNTGFVAYNLYIHSYAQALLFAVYDGIAVYGIIQWRKKNVRTKS